MSKLSVIKDSARAAISKIDAVTTDTADAHIAWVLSRHPGATPEQLIRLLGREYTATTALIGASTGAIAAAPGVGTGGAIGYAAFDIGSFTTASAASNTARAAAVVVGIVGNNSCSMAVTLLDTCQE